MTNQPILPLLGFVGVVLYLIISTGLSYWCKTNFNFNPLLLSQSLFSYIHQLTEPEKQPKINYVVPIPDTVKFKYSISSG